MPSVFVNGRNTLETKLKKNNRTQHISTCHALVNAEGDTLISLFLEINIWNE